ncbi:hypothetical protein [Stappia sp. WLB 29]|uniref:hypothetical protein n=1 Tax=Stappia sp. WLB 29 TaxID=2925220 RepID=UPI0020BE6AAF|nr:hypothetical protein [Stappia sp. WLB 29]
MKLPQFTKMPIAWINDGRLKRFRWGDEGSDNLAALMTYLAILNHMEPDTGVAHVTYDQLTTATSISRQKLSSALKLLQRREMIVPKPEGRSSIGVRDYNPTQHWAKVPARGLYRGGEILGLSEFRLRRRAELDAMKLYFLFAARRNRDTNMAQISYGKIEETSGIKENYIKNALTVLGANGLVHVERLQSTQSELGISNAYRLCHLHTRMHMGTAGRQDDFGLGSVTHDFDDPY